MYDPFNQINMRPLIKLRDYFKTLPKYYGKFNMGKFASDEKGDILYPREVPECGTSMCLLGHLPLLGYPGLEDEYWNRYCNRILNFNTESDDKNMLVIWEYLFASMWPSDIQLAVQRLDDVINKRKSIIDEDLSISLIDMVSNYNSLFE